VDDDKTKDERPDMVSTFPMQSFYRTVPTPIEAGHAQKLFSEEESSGILDDSLLDQSGIDSGLEMSPHMADSRRESLTLFSPKSEDWQQSVDMQSVPSNNPFLDQHNGNAFIQQQTSTGAFAPGSQSHSWSLTNSGSATPLQQPFDNLPSDIDQSSTPLFHRPATMQGATPFGNPGAQAAMFQQLGAQAIPTSPQKDHWLSQNQAMARRSRPHSPLARTHSELRRGDGIRKKNARFDIPAERNLSNIDYLISQSTDEQEIKELKQQKRLLRNRQAA
jgi:hypothetical protein